MNKGNKVVFIILLSMIGLLAASTGILLAMNFSNPKTSCTDVSQVNKPAADTSAVLADKDDTAVTTPTTQTATPATSSETPSAVTEAAPLGDRPSSPTDSHTVASGETLFQIASKYSLTWIQIADANGISEADANKIKVGQVLIIPKNSQIGYTVNQTKAQALQTEVNAGKKVFRLSAIDTAKSDVAPSYGIAVADTFKETKVDQAAGTATITVTKNGKIYEIKLTQPATKGEKGIWAIESIKPVNS